jgi:quinolinate synthase
MSETTDRIAELKIKHNAVILAHLYQVPEIQDVADFVGDSLELARKAKETDADTIVFCGVWFMAETAKILNPSKLVLLPEKSAGCPMADMVTKEDVLKLREHYPRAAVVCYVNSSAEVKAESDICCTSSNAVRVVQSLSEDEIIFVPDENLGRYVAGFCPDKKFIFHPGFCPTHQKIKAEDVDEAKKANPGVPVLVHPECVPAVIEKSDFAGSTAQIIVRATQGEEEAYLIGTESGILHRLQALNPGKRYIPLRSGLVCPNMKKISLHSLLLSLENLQYEIDLPPRIIERAARCVERMLELG